jgi:hypothetical protein
MAEVNGVNGKPVTVEGPGRYHVFLGPDGSWIVARATGICEKCQACGCGEQAEPIVVPAMVISLAQQQGLGRLKGLLRAATGRG